MDSTFHFRTILEDEVRAALKKLNPHKATGVDGISAHLLQIVASDVAPSITKLFNDSLTCGQIPTEWPMSLQSLRQQHLIQSPIFAPSQFYQ